MIAIIPMAGRGSRFSGQGYEMPKPLIPVAGKPMVVWALKSLEGLQLSKIIFILLREHEEQYNVIEMLRRHTKVETGFYLLDDITQGQLCTVLCAKDEIDGDEDVLIAASDTWVENNLQDDINRSLVDGLISVYQLPGDHWSFARVNEKEEVVEVAEKKRISDWASTGLYYFSRGSTLVALGKDMIDREEKTRGEYYVIPVYQKMIEAGLKVGISRANAMWDMGTPAAKEMFEKKYPR